MDGSILRLAGPFVLSLPSAGETATTSTRLADFGLSIRGPCRETGMTRFLKITLLDSRENAPDTKLSGPNAGG